jgi:type I restriction enzyme S subunit
MMREYKRYDEYKSVKVDWIDEIPKHWDKMKISHYFKIGRGRVISKGEIADNKGEYPVYSSQTENNGVLGFLNSYDFEGDYITWTTDGANAGTVFRRKGKFNCTNVCGTLEKMKEVNLTYSKYCLSVVTKRHVRKDINPKLMNNTMAEIRILKPSISEQRKISSFLNQKTAEIDEIINKKETLIDYLKKYKKSVITEAVTNGKLGDKYINKDGELVDELEMKDSGVEWLGEIPEYWVISKIKYEYTFFTGFTPPSGNDSYYDINGYDWLNISDIKNKYVYEAESKISDKAIREYRPKISKKNSLVFSFKLSIGKTAILKNNIYTNEALATFEKNKKNNIRYLYYIAPIFIPKNAKENIYGAKILNQRLINDALLLKPPKKGQQKIASYLDKKTSEIDFLIEKTKKSIQKYKKYKKSFIFEAVTGKIDLRDYKLEGGKEIAEYNNSRETEREEFSEVN